MSQFGDLVKGLRKEKGWTLEIVARKIGSHKGYVSGIENDKVNPPSVKIIRKFAKLFKQDERALVRLAWADKAPALIREDAVRFVTLLESEEGPLGDLVRVPLLNTLETGPCVEVGPDGRPKPRIRATLVLPRTPNPPEWAATVWDDSMEQDGEPGYSRGDVVLLVREEKVQGGSTVYVVYDVRGEKQARLRQVRVDPGSPLVLQPLNPRHPVEFITQDDVDAIFRVVGKIAINGRARADVKV